jgi:hypothetical protein
MPQDVRAALERFQQFIGRFGMSGVVDEESGFTVGDAMLLIGEVEMAGHPDAPEENPFD